MERATNGNVIVNLGLSNETISHLNNLNGSQLQEAVGEVINRLDPKTSRAVSLQEGTNRYVSTLGENERINVFNWEIHVLDNYKSQLRTLAIEPEVAFLAGYAIAMTIAYLAK